MWTYFPALRPATIDDLRRLYERWERGSPDTDEIWLNWICRLRASGSPIGTMQATVRKPDVAYVAYAIFPAFQRKRYAAEAIREINSYLHSGFGCKRIRAEMDARNTPSLRLIESLGFERIETHTAPDLGQGHATDEYLYELLSP